MPEFLELVPPNTARSIFHNQFIPDSTIEIVDTEAALNRVTSAPILAPEPLPAFSRSTVDGYAVRAEDVYGAMESLPIYLKKIGEIPMGQQPTFEIFPGTCSLIHTGGMVLNGANAVVMLEHTQVVRPDEIEILKPVAVGENVIQAGEDVLQGQSVISAGTRLRAVDIGGLMALGLTSVSVASQPRVGIISCGDEVVSPEIQPRLAQVRDVNSYALSAVVEQAGGFPIRYGIFPDLIEKLKTIAEQALDECSMVIISAGSSASVRDLTADVIKSLGKPGVLVHGVNVRPGKPTILAVCNGKPVIGLPGNPVSAMVISWLFVVPAIEKLLGIQMNTPSASIEAKLTINLPSQAGREEWVAVKLTKSDSSESPEYLAEPIFGKSNLIFTLIRADGLICIPSSANGLEAGHIVQAYLI